MANELVIYTDESDRTGAYFSNFYGGLLVRSKDLATVIGRLDDRKRQQHLFNELKWQKVTENYLDKYIAMMAELFDLIASDVVKARVMFTSNQYVPIGLTSEQRQSEYHRLYYQFIKHAFGLPYCHVDVAPPVRVRLNIDQMPTSKEETAQFKSFVAGLNQNSEMRRGGVRFDVQQMAEVASHDHVLLQCLDVVLGAMSFRLNNKHEQKPVGSRTRGKRTQAKERLYKFISGRIREIYPHFNIGESTSTKGDLANRWKHPYRHWKLVPKEHQRDPSRAKP